MQVGLNNQLVRSHGNILTGHFSICLRRNKIKLKVCLWFVLKLTIEFLCHQYNNVIE